MKDDKELLDKTLKDYQYSNTNEITCPYCGSVIFDSWEYSQDYDTLECEICGKKFKYNRNIEITYTSEKINDVEKI